MSKFLFFFIENKRKLVLYTAGLFFFIALINIASLPFRQNDAPLKNFKKIKELKKVKPIPNFKLKRKQAMDSLVDNNLLTPENIKKVDQKYPDSLCGC